MLHTIDGPQGTTHREQGAGGCPKGFAPWCTGVDDCMGFSFGEVDMEGMWWRIEGGCAWILL